MTVPFYRVEVLVMDPIGATVRRSRIVPVNELRAKGMDEEKIEKSEEFEEQHHYASIMLQVGDEMERDVDVDRGETVTLTLKFDRPGTYYYV
ncbi:MAG: hypothetical protein QXP93_06895 [Nitrososphaerota archaeon]